MEHNLRPAIRLRAVFAAKQGPVWYSQAVLSATSEYHPSTTAQQKSAYYQDFLGTGATGLEPATSGVTVVVPDPG